MLAKLTAIWRHDSALLPVSHIPPILKKVCFDCLGKKSSYSPKVSGKFIFRKNFSLSRHYCAQTAVEILPSKTRFFHTLLYTISPSYKTRPPLSRWCFILMTNSFWFIVIELYSGLLIHSGKERGFSFSVSVTGKSSKSHTYVAWVKIHHSPLQKRANTMDVKRLERMRISAI